jgi:hypothetical protein
MDSPQMETGTQGKRVACALRTALCLRGALLPVYRATIELAELYRTTSADLKTDIVVNVQVRKSPAFLSSANKREAMEENIE